jgi:hypothetical protein
MMCDPTNEPIVPGIHIRIQTPYMGLKSLVVRHNRLDLHLAIVTLLLIIVIFVFVL